ncbi:hypothetical protein [Arcticibacter sp.]|jgi:hypothetical protein|uniref:hypothetical protein n=1 Tax=Arcticibacter sp. TaxID=1872630 RepID=UPI00388D315B
MKTKSTAISPFIMLLIPALLAMLVTLSHIKESRTQEATTFSYLSVPALKGLLNTGFNCRLW